MVVWEMERMFSVFFEVLVHSLISRRTFRSDSSSLEIAVEGRSDPDLCPMLVTIALLLIDLLARRVYSSFEPR